MANTFTRLTLSAVLSVYCSASAAALDPSCAMVIDATEKSARQPARHSITEIAGERLEAIIVDGVMYNKMGGNWRKLKSDFGVAERKLVEEMRSGVIVLNDCANLGTESFEGRPTTVVQYRLLAPGAAGFGDELTKLYIGADGLIYGLKTDDSTLRQSYTNVSAP